MSLRRKPLIVLSLNMLVASPCLAQSAMTASSIAASSPNLSNVVSAATGDAIYRVTARGGAISDVSVGGKRASAGTRITTVTVACVGGQCAKTNAKITVTNLGAPTSRRALTNLTVAMGTATLVSGPTGTNTVSFTIGPIASGSSKTFFVGGDFPIADDDSDLATGSVTFGFAVSIVPSSGGTTHTLTASADGLAFGGAVRPSVGSGTVSIDDTTGARTVTGTGAIGLPSPAPARVVYTATGEGGQAISITVPATFTMTSGANTLTVTTTATATGAQALSSTLGSGGTFAFGVGGSFPFSSTTASGNYSGTFMVTLANN